MLLLNFLNIDFVDLDKGMRKNSHAMYRLEWKQI